LIKKEALIAASEEKDIAEGNTTTTELKEPETNENEVTENGETQQEPIKETDNQAAGESNVDSTVPGNSEEGIEEAPKSTDKKYRKSYKSLFSHPFFTPLKHKADSEMVNIVDELNLNLGSIMDSEREKSSIAGYCEEFDNLNPNFDYYRYVQLGAKIVN
jgi:hypothetical protein